MDFATEIIGDVKVISVPCEVLDAGTADDFKRSIAEELNDGCNLVLDISAVEFMDSTGCGAILSCLRHVVPHGGDLRLGGVQKTVRIILELVRMHRIVDMYNTREEALASYK